MQFSNTVAIFVGCGIGPLYKPYVYKSRKGAVASSISWNMALTSLSPSKLSETISAINGDVVDKNCPKKFDEQELSHQRLSKHESDISKSYRQNQNGLTEIETVKLNGVNNGLFPVQCSVYFNGGCYFEMEEQALTNVTVLSNYLDLPQQPPAIVKCICDKGVAVLMGPHLEYDASDLDDGNEFVEHMIPEFIESSKMKTLMMKHLLKELNINVKSG